MENFLWCMKFTALGEGPVWDFWDWSICGFNLEFIITCQTNNVLCIYTQRNISMYYRTQSAIWPIRLHKYSQTHKLLTFPLGDDHFQHPWGFLPCNLGWDPMTEDHDLSGYLSHYVSACTWVWTHVLCVPWWVCYPKGHSGRHDT